MWTVFYLRIKRPDLYNNNRRAKIIFSTFHIAMHQQIERLIK